jgi:hypothetical protein
VPVGLRGRGAAVLLVELPRRPAEVAVAAAGRDDRNGDEVDGARAIHGFTPRFASQTAERPGPHHVGKDR